jgi:1-acyl-sn-glycerol-3-phosphate acyltransferase
MNIATIKQALYGLYLTNSFGWRLKRAKTHEEKRALRIAYSHKQLKALNITLEVKNSQKLPSEGQYLVVVNHRSIIDPPIVEIALQKSDIFGCWISKKELYNSLFFGLFVRNAGSILLDRQKSQMSSFFADTKEAVKRGESIFIFPEGTRNKSSEGIASFKEGSRIIALKNRLPILPIYIKTHADRALGKALQSAKTPQTITVVVGDIISYKERRNLEESYREQFDLAKD